MFLQWSGAAFGQESMSLVPDPHHRKKVCTSYGGTQVNSTGMWSFCRSIIRLRSADSQRLRAFDLPHVATPRLRIAMEAFSNRPLCIPVYSYVYDVVRGRAS